MEPELTISDHHDQQAWVVAVAGEMDILSAPRVRDHVLSRLGQAQAGRFVFDLSGVMFMDSAGLGFTIALLKRAAAAGLQVAVVIAHAEVVRLFAVTGVGRAYPLFSSVEAALAAR